MAARYEQARGDNTRAADSDRATLAATPKVSPADRPVHTLVHPEQDTRVHRPVTAADLERLLDPDYEPFAKTTEQLPAQPAHGPDPYNSAPAVQPPSQPADTNPTMPPTATPGPGAQNEPRSIVEGHDFIRAESASKTTQALAPARFSVRDGAFLNASSSINGAQLVFALWSRDRPRAAANHAFLRSVRN